MKRMMKNVVLFCVCGVILAWQAAPLELLH